tara:strand:- start:354 stop:533 length:180 start_codon:yes stop_codon:yes gene_type:complete
MKNNNPWLPHSELVLHLEKKGRFKHQNPPPKSRAAKAKYLKGITNEFKAEWNKLNPKKR